MNDWTIEHFLAEQIKDNIRNGKFTIPRYQRKLVWKPKQKEDLIDTIKKGLPFGTLLLYRDDNNNCQIIDGHQRSDAIIKFVENPTQFFDEGDIDVSVIRKIVELIGTAGNLQAQEEKVTSMLIEWVKKKHRSLQDVEEMQFPKFGKVVSNEFPSCIGKEFEIGDLIAPMMRKYKDICKKISITRIPAIVLSGSDEYLPLLFERINHNGTQLSKYEIYAATWNREDFKLDDSLSEIVTANKDRYDAMSDDGAIDDYDSAEFMRNKKVNAFELAFGFGKYLCRKWPHLFGDSKDIEQVESIGFTLIGCCLGLKNKDAKILNVALSKRVGAQSINRFLLAILNAVDFTDKLLGKYSKFKLNSRSSSLARPLHTEFQIVSIIASVFIDKYVTEIRLDNSDNVIAIDYCFESANRDWKAKDKKLYERNLPKIYIMDILLHRWSGSGDKRMDSVLFTRDTYKREVTLQEFSRTLDGWFTDLNNERKEFKRVSAPKEAERLFLAVIYLGIFTASQQIDGSNYDVEHLAPQALMKKQLDRFDGNLRLPISSVGNLCLLPEYANRSKRDKTIYHDRVYLQKSQLTLREIEEKYSFTKSADLEWIEDFECTAEEFEKDYKTFLQKRFDVLKEKVLNDFDHL